MQFPIIKQRKIWFGFSAILLVASIYGLVAYGLNLGVDFTGGSLIELRISGEASNTQMRELIESQGFGEVRVQASEGGDYLIRLQALNEEQHQALLTAIETSFGETEELRFDFVGPVIGAELARKAIWSVVVLLILIVLYVAWAFRKVAHPVTSWKYGVLTMVTALHDVIVPLGVFAFLGHFYGYQVDSAFVAAILTILGYSINDTIVVFDRTRENLAQRSSEDPFEEVVNRGVNQSLARSLNTTLTTLLALVAVYFFGGDTTRQFALALMIGIATGAYSSVFIASPLLVVWEKWKR